MKLKELAVVKEFNNSKEDWIAIVLYIFLAPFVITIGFSLLFGAAVCISIYMVVDFCYKAVVYFRNSIKGQIK